jgi:asparagine synthetase B (glutamine-hydrolysing)
MCGLAGLIRLDGSRAEQADEAVVRAMCELTSYRGPDDQGISAIGPLCLGSRRLAIIDVSPAGHMPMADPTGRWWIAYNGETYNFRETRDELERRGVDFRSHSDTVVVLHAWMTWGPACLDRLAGMFARNLRQQDRCAFGPRSRPRRNRFIDQLDGRAPSPATALPSHRRGNRIDLQSLSEWWFTEH